MLLRSQQQIGIYCGTNIFTNRSQLINKALLCLLHAKICRSAGSSCHHLCRRFFCCIFHPGQLKNCLNAFFRKIMILQETDHFSALRPDMINQHIKSHLQRLINFRAVFQQIIIIVTVLGCQRLVQAGNTSVIQTGQQPQIFRQPFLPGRLTQNVQACVNLHVFQIRNVVMQSSHIIFKGFILFPQNFIFQIRFLHLFQYQLLQLGQVFRSCLPEVYIFFHSLFQLFQFIIGSSLGLRCRKMFIQHSRPSAFCLYSFPGYSHVIDIHVRQLPKGQVRIAGSAEAGILSRQPFKGAMGSDMGYGICFPYIPHPLIKGQVLMCRGAVRRMIYLGRIFPKTPGRLNGNEHIAIHCAGNHQLSAIFHNAARRLSPIFFQLRLHFFFKCSVKFSVYRAINFI